MVNDIKMADAYVRRRDHMARGWPDLFCYNDSLLQKLTLDPMRTIYMPSEGSTPNGLTTSH
jgi:hypothetical protein